MTRKTAITTQVAINYSDTLMARYLEKRRVTMFNFDPLCFAFLSQALTGNRKPIRTEPRD